MRFGTGLFGVSTWLVACTRDPTIGDVLAQPDRFIDSTIAVRGKVVDPSGVTLLGVSMWSYKLVDGPDTLLVVSSKQPTEKAKRTSVVGRIRSTMMLGFVRIGPVLEETSVPK